MLYVARGNRSLSLTSFICSLCLKTGVCSSVPLRLDGLFTI